MTSNERKILKYLWDAKGRAHVGVISENVGITADYTRLLCRSLVRSGYIKFADASVCYLLTRGRNCFQRNDEPAPEELPEVSQVVLASSAPISPGDGHDFDDKNEELPSASNSEEKAQATVISEETPQAVLASITTFPEKTVEVEEEKKVEPQEINKTEAKPADNPASTTPLPVRRSPRLAEAFGEAQVGEGGKSPEKAVPKKEGSAKPSGGFGVSFKKIVNWFAKKK